MLSSILNKSDKKDVSAETIAILRLIRSENVGPKTFRSLVAMAGSVEKALEIAPDLSRRGGRSKPIKIFSMDSAKEEIEALNKIGAKLISYTDEKYPALLKQIPDFPPILSYRGNMSLLASEKIIAMVGARNSSANAKLFAAQIAKDLVAENYVTISGLARGIDAAVHEASGNKTIAVIAGGIDHIYPPENKDLFEKISQNGLLLAELPIGCSPVAQHFPQRNRIIAGIAFATAVIEASLKSGSLITANFALEYNRDVFAMPGFPLDPRCMGSNKLLKDGAFVLESSEDIMHRFSSYVIKNPRFSELLNEGNDFRQLTQSANSIQVTDSDRKSVLSLLSYSPIDIEVLAQEVKLSLPIVYMICLELELAGRIVRHGSNKITLKHL